MNKPAILLGSFDPPTNGHLHLVSEALKVGIPRVYMIPSWGNPWKTGQTSYWDRLEMTKRLELCYWGGKLKVSGIEGELATALKEHEHLPTYLVLRELKKILGDFLIISTNETYKEIKDWINGEEVLRDYEFLIFSTTHLGEEIPGSIQIQDLPISSTMVRNLRRERKPYSEYIQESVGNYIITHNLYL
jgi:nicotinate (nicotinamide) nucleotide adenylyltransferase